jgi:flagellar hook assembly protein FlgD
VLANNYIPAGVKSFQWDSKDRNGKPVPSGVYFYHLETSSFKTSKKMILIK